MVDGGLGDDGLFGIQGSDRLYGEDGDDVMTGGQADPGDDLLDGGPGNDALVNAGPGDDTLLGGEGDDVLAGHGDDDTLHGDEGDDVLVGGPGDDALSGGPGDDRLYGAEGDDEINGRDGDDVLDGGAERDAARGSVGDDACLGAERVVACESVAPSNPTAASGRPATCDGDIATVVGTAGNDFLVGTAGRDVVAGLGGDDVLWGLDGDDVLCGGRGRNVLVGGSGDDRMLGERLEDGLFGDQGATNVTRMDYVSPLSNELVWSMAVEQLLDLELPPRATWIRMYLVELNRIASHLLFQATNGMDIGALSMMIYGWRDREETLRLLEKITGLRMNHNFIRPGGVAADLPDGWEEDTIALLDQVEKGVRDYCGAPEREPDLARAARRRRHAHDRAGARARCDRADPAFDRLPVGPAQGAAVPRLRRGRLRRRLHRERRLLRPLPDPSRRDRRVGEDRPPVRRAHARRRLPHRRTARSLRRPAPASTSRWRR